MYVAERSDPYWKSFMFCTNPVLGDKISVTTSPILEGGKGWWGVPMRWKVSSSWH